MTDPRILAIAQGDPLGFATWSGCSLGLFGEFQRRDQLAGTVDMSLPKPADVVARGLTIHPDRAVWRARSSLGRARVAMSSMLAQRRTTAVADKIDVTLQIGSWSKPPEVPGAIRATYLDSAIGQMLHRPGTPIGPETSFARWRSEFEHSVYAELDLIFTMSEWTKASLITDLGVSPDKVVVARPGPNPSNLAGAAEPRPERHPWRSGVGPHLLFIGKKWERKGGPMLLAAFTQLRKAFPDAQLSVIGPDHALPPTPGVRYWGRINRAEPASARLFERIFASADLFVMPSEYEPFGIVFLEAMSRGLPAIGANHCAMPEIIADGVTGGLVERDDAESLAELLIDLAGDPDRVAAMGEAAQARAQQQFSWELCVDTMNEAFAARQS